MIWNIAAVISILAGAAYALRGPYLRWYWNQRIVLRCGYCGQEIWRRRGDAPPNYRDWIALCGSCAHYECLANGECPDCQSPIPKDAAEDAGIEIINLRIAGLPTHHCEKSGRPYSMNHVRHAKECIPGLKRAGEERAAAERRK
jgi:hypothetical protein